MTSIKSEGYMTAFDLVVKQSSEKIEEKNNDTQREQSAPHQKARS